MRIGRLDLLRYGKFTDHTVLLPQSRQDFHLIIGPNEAGKSTLRSAILDLFFGIETRSSYNFLHSHSEMKLGASIEQEDQSLDFYRVKARRQPLFDASGTPLALDVLNEFLGATDRSFFDQMFGLNHEKLVTGGNEILHAASDVGQILFQAAVGIGGLGKIRDALEAEADKLWARRKSGERVYYVACDALAEADAELKRVTVRTKDWAKAQDGVNQWESSLEQSRQQYHALETERIRLERMRRIAPVLSTLQETDRELTKLGGVIELPPDAARQFADGEAELARAEQEYTFYQNHLLHINSQLKCIHLDKNLLKHESDIEELSARRQQFRHHETNIVKRQQEIKTHWQHIEALARQLDWPATDEKQLVNRLPSLPVITAIQNLLKRYEALHQRQQTSNQAVSNKQKEMQFLETQLVSLPATNASAMLRTALRRGQELGDVRNLISRFEAQVSKANQQLDAARTGLGQWRLDAETLRHITLPSMQSIAQLKKRLICCDSAAEKLQEKWVDINSAIQNQTLEITQYRNAHHPITEEELLMARQARNTAWSFIKTDGLSLAAASELESKIQDTDTIADKRYDKAQETSTLQSKMDHLQRMQQQKEDLQAQIDANQESLLAIQNEWMDTLTTFNLPAIPLLDMEEWLQAREQLLCSASAVKAENQALATLQQDEAEIKSALLACVSNNEATADASMSLSTLIVIATDLIEDAVKTRAHREELTRQREAARVALLAIQEKAAVAQVALDEWKIAWHENLLLAEIKGDADIGAVEGMLQLICQIEEKLNQIDQLREEHIGTMRADLDDFERAVVALTLIVAPDLSQSASLSVVIELAARLEKARSAHKECARLEHESISYEKQLAAIQIRINHARSKIQSLLQLADVATMDELRDAIKRSDKWCSLNTAMSAAKKNLLESGDGLTRQQLEAELQAVDVSQIRITLDELAKRKEALLQQQTVCAAQLATAKTALSAIAGQDDAARAEAKRQDALARMSIAVERYVKVYTSARLLRWAIDRYREIKQGPMLERADKIFSTLTLGAFQKLVVDFDIQPYALEGRRADGTLVGISGMSDGTRDQLYFALRLAALELHLEQAQRLPFIADDLLINYDDTRAKAGLEVLADLAEKTQVIFLSHHDHLVPVVQAVFGQQVNVVRL